MLSDLKLLLKLLDAESTGATPEQLAYELPYSLEEIKELLYTARGLTIDPSPLGNLELTEAEIKAFIDMFKLRALNLPEKVWMVCYEGFRVYCLAKTRDDAVEIAGAHQLGRLQKVVPVISSEKGDWSSELVAEVVVHKVVRVEVI